MVCLYVLQQASDTIAKRARGTRAREHSRGICIAWRRRLGMRCELVQDLFDAYGLGLQTPPWPPIGRAVLPRPAPLLYAPLCPLPDCAGQSRLHKQGCGLIWQQATLWDDQLRRSYLCTKKPKEHEMHAQSLSGQLKLWVLEVSLLQTKCY